MRLAGWQAGRPAGSCVSVCATGPVLAAAPDGKPAPLHTQTRGKSLLSTNRHAAPDDEAALHVLGAASRALAVGGSIVVVEPLLADSGGGGHAYLEDLSLMVVGGGRDRTLREWTDLFERAGLELVGVHPAAAGGSMLCRLGVLVARKRP